MCRNYGRADREDDLLAGSATGTHGLCVACERSCLYWRSPPFFVFSAKAACLGVLKVGDKRWYTRIEPRFRPNEVGAGAGAQQRIHHTHKVIQAVPSSKKSNSKKNVVKILNFKLKKDPGQA